MDSCDSHGRSRQHDGIDQRQIFMGMPVFICTLDQSFLMF